jgi:hypothetical protein
MEENKKPLPTTKEIIANFFSEKQKDKTKSAKETLEKFFKLFSDMQDMYTPLCDPLSRIVHKIYETNKAFDAYVVSTYPKSLSDEEVTKLIAEATFHFNSFRDRMEQITAIIKKINSLKEIKEEGEKKKRIRKNHYPD